MADDVKVRYSDEDLGKFKEIIVEKIEQAQKEMTSFYTHRLR